MPSRAALQRPWSSCARRPPAALPLTPMLGHAGCCLPSTSYSMAHRCPAPVCWTGETSASLVIRAPAEILFEACVRAPQKSLSSCSSHRNASGCLHANFLLAHRVTTQVCRHRAHARVVTPLGACDARGSCGEALRVGAARASPAHACRKGRRVCTPRRMECGARNRTAAFAPLALTECVPLPCALEHTHAERASPPTKSPRQLTRPHEHQSARLPIRQVVWKIRGRQRSSRRPASRAARRSTCGCPTRCRTSRARLLKAHSHRNLCGVRCWEP